MSDQQLDALLGLGEQSFRKSYYPELQRVIAELEKEREKFRTIFNNSVQLIGLLDTQGTLLEANARALTLINCQLADVVGKPFWETPWWRGNPEGQTLLRHNLGLALRGETTRFETTHQIGPENRQMIIEFSITPLRDNKGQIILLIPEGHDITEQETLEAEKIRALGHLVAGISHEINTPLGISYTGITFLRSKLTQMATQLEHPDFQPDL